MAISPLQKRLDCRHLHKIISQETGWPAQLWGARLENAIVGYGHYHYKYDSGREGDFFRTGFAARAQNICIYIMPGYQDFHEELTRLGKHKTGKSCLYIKTLSDIDEKVLIEILRKALVIMARKYPL